MEYKYEDIINGLNSGKIRNILFSVKDYSHYGNCSITSLTCDGAVSSIEVRLTEDESEVICFYGKMRGEHKIFSFGKKGAYSLKQIWKFIEISKIEYFPIEAQN